MKTFTIKDYPLDHAWALFALGETYCLIAEKANKPESANKSVSCFKDTQKIFSHKNYPDLFQKCSEAISKAEKLMIDKAG